jgi:hypothetical protein
VTWCLYTTEPDGLHYRWLQEYQVASDRLLTRFDAHMGQPPAVPRINHITPEVIEFALEFYGRQIEEVKRQAREQPGRSFSIDFYITHEEMAQRYGRNHAHVGSQLRVRLPNDFQVREGRLDILYGYQSMLAQTERSKAEEKSIELLKSWLTPAQRTEYEKTLAFCVVGSDTATRYRLVSEPSYNILELDAEGALTGQKFCVVPRGHVAMGDQLLAQKIWLETDETRTLKIANKVLRTGQTTGNLLGANQIAREAVRLFQNSNAFFRNLNWDGVIDLVEVQGEAQDD